jgi:hypothetical protein
MRSKQHLHCIVLLGDLFLLWNRCQLILITTTIYDGKMKLVTEYFMRLIHGLESICTLNVNETHILQFTTMNHDDYGMHNNISHNLTVNSECIKFWG